MLGLGDGLAQDVDAFGFEPLQVRQLGHRVWFVSIRAGWQFFKAARVAEQPPRC